MNKTTEKIINILIPGRLNFFLLFETEIMVLNSRNIIRLSIRILA
jgi:hypothetical protein